MRMAGTSHGIQKRSVLSVRMAGTSHKFPKRSVLPVGAHLCVRPPRLGVPVRTRADTQVRTCGIYSHTFWKGGA